MKAEVSIGWGRLGLGVLMLGAQWVWAACGGEELSPWPGHFDVPQGRCTVFEPQPTALRGDRLSARAALAVAAADSTNVVFGIAELEATVAQNADRQQATITGIIPLQTKFVPADAAAMSGLSEAVKPGLAQLTWTLSSTELDARLEAVTREREAAQEIKTTPPKILYSPVPAALIVLDGPPQLRPLTNSPLMRVVNTPYAMLFHTEAKTYWLQGADTWFSAVDWRGEWLAVGQPPTEVAAAVPKGTTAKPASPATAGGLPPRLVVSDEPTELIVTRGAPTYTPVDGSELLYVSNSEQLLFLEIATRQYYVVFSGRWYRSAALAGPWETVAVDQLPAAFARIPPGSPKSEALTYVAGTKEAADAVVRAEIPQITAVNRSATNLVVTYEGAPSFQPVANTGIQSASNTADAVFLVRGDYYLCRDAVWYTGPGPEGPWSIATSVPVEIQSLPPSHPHYNVKYVYVYGSTPEVVYAGYVPGYAGCYVAGPTVVYGTGWCYPGWYGPASYWAYPATFGFGFAYNSWSGWSVGVGFGYGWLGCGYGWGWGGCYPVGWWGPCGAYWSCAPYYPCYAGHPSSPPPPPPGSPPPGGQPPPPGGQAAMRADPRKDAPTPYDRPSNPQRRALPEYARNAKAPYQAPTTLNSPRRADAKAGGLQASNRNAGPSRSMATTQGTTVPQRSAARSDGSMAAPSRATVGTLAGTPSSPARSASSAQPGRTVQNPSATVPTRSAPNSIASAPVRQSAPVRTPPSTYSGQPRSTVPTRFVPSSSAFSSPSRSGGVAARSPAYSPAPYRSGTVYSPGVSSWSGRSSYGGYSSGAPMRSASGGLFSSPMRSGGAPSGFSAPMRSGGAPSGFSAPMRSAPAAASPGYSGGSMGRGGVSRGR